MIYGLGEYSVALVKLNNQESSQLMGTTAVMNRCKR